MNLELCITQSKTGGEKFKSWSKRLWKLLNHYSSTTCPFKARKRRQPYENGLEWNHKWLRMVIIWMANTCKFQFKRFLKLTLKIQQQEDFLAVHSAHHMFSRKPNRKIRHFDQSNQLLLKKLVKIREYKCQLISKYPFGVFKFPKKQRNFCKDFCSSL